MQVAAARRGDHVGRLHAWSPRPVDQPGGQRPLCLAARSCPRRSWSACSRARRPAHARSTRSNLRRCSRTSPACKVGLAATAQRCLFDAALRDRRSRPVRHHRGALALPDARRGHSRRRPGAGRQGATLPGRQRSVDHHVGRDGQQSDGSGGAPWSRASRWRCSICAGCRRSTRLRSVWPSRIPAGKCSSSTRL